MDARVHEHINLPIKQVFEVLSESDEIQERAPGLHIHKEIEVTIRIERRLPRRYTAGRLRAAYSPATSSNGRTR